MTSRLVDKPLTNLAYGFPGRGARRRIKPVILAVLHITGNSRTAAYADPMKGVAAERTYANRAGSTGPSAHLYIGRDGRGLRAIDWRAFAAWSNGDVNQPDRSNPRIVRALELRAKGYNFNEACGVEVECVGYGSSLPIVSPQLDTLAEELARAARYFGLPVSLETIIGHFQINGVNRVNCPSSAARHAAVLGELVTRTKAWYTKLYAPPVVIPPVIPPVVEEPAVIVIDKTPKMVASKIGSTLLDLNGKPLVTVANDAFRLSPGGVASGRLVFTYFAGGTHLGIAPVASIVSVVDVIPPAPADQLAAIAKLEATLRSVDERDAAVAAGATKIKEYAEAIVSALA